MRANRLAAVTAVSLAVGAGLVWWRLGLRPQPHPDAGTTRTSAILPAGPPSDAFRQEPIGQPLRENERPQISNVQIVDLDRDGLPDVLACDVTRKRVVWLRQAPRGSYTEVELGEPIAAPAHVEAIDLDNDADLDLLIANLGVLMPSNNRIGSVVVLENDGQQRFANRTISDRIARAADARAADLDEDGDLDIAVAGFGYDTGETSWLENRGRWTFEQHVIQRLSGGINAIPADLDRDGLPDIVNLVSQEWEDVWGLMNQRGGRFAPKMLWGSSNPDFGSSWSTVVDMDRDGDPDVLVSNGDAFDYAPSNSRPWHGVQWLENTGTLAFEAHRIGDLPGASSPIAADLDGDGDLDVAVASAYNNWDDANAHSLVWLENNGQLQFAMRTIARSPTHLITLAVGDMDGDGTEDLVTGGMHISRPYDRMSRVTVWSNRAPASAR